MTEEIRELIAACNALLPWVRQSNQPMISDLLYRSPASSLRHQAEQMERRDAAIERFEAALLRVPAPEKA